jgi:DNA-binding beta-propeller fold protein YncE
MVSRGVARRARVAACAAVLVLLAACAPSRAVMRYDPHGNGELRVWPPEPTREVPRYRYLGELTGEANFADPPGTGTGARGLIRWLVGLGEHEPSPTVLQRPQGGAVDGTGRILVTDISRRAVFVFDEAGGRLDVWEEAAPQTRFAAPIGVAIGPAGQVLVTDAELGRVFRLDRDGKPLGSFGAGVLKRPTGIARDPQRNLVFVADTYAHDIKVFDDEGRLVGTLGVRGDGPGEFNFPAHLAFARGVLYVSDILNSRVQGIAAGGDVKLSFGERGLYVGNLVRPKGVATDDEGNVYVVESLYDTLLVFDRDGRLLMSIGGTGKEAGKFFLPAGVWVDSRNRVFVADMFNGRVAVFQFLGGS